MKKTEQSIFPDILVSDDFPEIRIPNKEVCFYCHSEPVSPGLTCCPVCRFPQNGLALEQEAFITDAREKAARHLQLEYIIGWAQTTLQFTGIAAILISVIEYSSFYSLLTSESAGMGQGTLLFSFFFSILAAIPNIGLWLWSKKKPFAAIVTALCLTLSGILFQILSGEIRLIAISLPLLFAAVFTHALISYRETIQIEKELLFDAKHIA